MKFYQKLVEIKVTVVITIYFIVEMLNSDDELSDSDSDFDLILSYEKRDNYSSIYRGF